MDVTFDSGVKVATGMHVVVVDLKGKTIYDSVGQPDIDTNPTTVTTGYPEDSTNIHWINKPTPGTEVGTQTGTVQVTYPDGSTGKAKVTYITSNPQWVTPTPTTQTGKVPDPTTVVTINPGSTDIKPGPGGNTTVEWKKTPDGTTKDVTGPITVTKDDIIEHHQYIGDVTLVRHVHFVEQGHEDVDLATPVDQPVEFKVYADTKDGKPIEGTFVLDPKSGEFAAVAAKKIPGYTVIPSQADGIAAEVAKPTIKHANQINGEIDLDQYINYTKNASETGEPIVEPDKPVFPIPNPTPGPDTPEPTPTPTPDKPKPQPTSAKSEDEDQPAPTPHATNTPEDENKTAPAPHAAKTPAMDQKHAKKSNKWNNNGPLNRSEEGRKWAAGPVKAEQVAANKRALMAANKVSCKAKVLPQTGSKSNGLIAAIGTAIAAVGSLFGFASRKKRNF